MTIVTVKSVEAPGYIVLEDDLIPLVSNDESTRKGVTSKQLAAPHNGGTETIWFPIPKWNMDALTQIVINRGGLGLGLERDLIIGMSAVVTSNTGTRYDFMSMNGNETTDHVIQVTTSNFTLKRGTNGIFDHPDFDVSAGDFDRGWMVVVQRNP